MSSDAAAPSETTPAPAPSEATAAPSETTPAPAPSEATAAPTEKKMIVLRSSDAETFEVEKKVAVLSLTVKNMVEDCDSPLYPLPNVTSNVMAKFIEYCKRHVEAAEKAGGEADPATYMNDDLKEFDEEFMKVEVQMLIDLVLAANYLDTQKLLDLTCQTIANKMKGMKIEDIRQLFGIENDFTPEEEEAVRKEHEWAFE